VDDDPLTREMVATMVKRLCGHVEQAASGAEAIEKAKAHIPAVIISDWYMPEMDGVELCRAVRSIPQLALTHFLILTSRTESDALVQALEGGADDFLTKPMNPSELRARVKVGLRVNALHRESDRLRREAQEAASSLRVAQERLRQALGKLDDQIREIADLQTAFLPTRFEPVGGLSFAATYRPCYNVGGDYYDVFEMPDGRVCFCIGDVTGHGARAAVLMAMTRSLTRAAVLQIRSGDGPAWMLNRINNWLLGQLTLGQFVTMWLGLWDPHAKIVRYARAGHPPAVLWPYNGELSLLSNDGVPPVGLVEYCTMPPENVQPLLPGDRLVLLTDGWMESVNTEGKQLGMDGMFEFLHETEGLDLESVPLQAYHQLERYVANAAITDDGSLLIAECLPDKEEPTQPWLNEDGEIDR